MEDLGLRLEKTIRTKYSEKQQFADEIGISKEYLSRLISGKKTISVKFAKKAALILGVTEDYLLGVASEPYSDEVSNIILWNKQQYLFLPLQALLTNMGLTITPVIYIDNDKYEYDGKRWMGNRYFDEGELMEYISLNRKKKITYGVLLSAGTENALFMEHEEFLEWQKNLINHIGTDVRKDIPGLKAPILNKTISDDIKRIIEDKEPIKWE